MNVPGLGRCARWNIQRADFAGARALVGATRFAAAAPAVIG